MDDMIPFAFGIGVGAFVLASIVSFQLNKLRLDFEDLKSLVMHMAEKQIVLKHAFDKHKRKVERVT